MASTPTSGQPGADAGAAPPAGEAVGRSAGPGSVGGRGDGCGLPEGDQGIPSSKAPAADGWDVSRRVVVPRSSAYGPGTTDPDGFRRCFAHSPTGAVYAAYSVLAALADQSKTVPTATKLLLPGPDTDALLREARKETPSESSNPPQIAGYRVLDAGRERVTIMLAMPVQTEFMSATLTLTWYDGDWRLIPPQGAGPVGAPYARHRNLNDFVAWSGV
ncbi:hypothetical protein [Streptomyces sp. SID13031]|uniref:hypothetical protein n=1 Tax=Streptomyces sp. SID13031 TaxID=2706046 RepID=UPI0013CCD703|nr:hypothetical protein [Streptomyces sp. SID13031]NEA33195.1 hypothetical protein [Streptomyces sp. SID13031]